MAADKLAQELFEWQDTIPPLSVAMVPEIAGAWALRHAENWQTTVGGVGLLACGLAFGVGTVVYGVRAKSAQAKNDRFEPEQ